MKLNDRQLEALFKAPDPAIRAILLFGPDIGKVKDFAEKLGKSILPDLNDPFRLADLTGAQLREDPALLSDEAAALSMTGGRRLIRVRDAADGNAEVFAAFLADAKGDSLVVAEAGNLTPASKLRKLFESARNAGLVACYADDERDLKAFIRTTFQQAGIRCNEDALSFLGAHLGADRMQTRMELEKLVLYAGPGGTLTLEDARAGIGDSAALRLDDIIFAMAEGDTEGADSALARARSEGMSFQPILRAAQQHLRVLQVAGELVAAGQSIDAAFKAAGFRGLLWKVSDRLSRQLRNWPSRRLGEAMERLMEAEMLCKTTGMPADTVTSQTILALALSARARARNAPGAYG
ncbi:MAG: DNA polymerase III subunit delta [Alphaproteobacteria bacterium]|nr:DNA polymerase III subunit delta [Alphaproteobacteria bacterium]MBU0798895.1 DNA polymerase III subunit delta [Alphaproteobacteria bacterium]MBU0886283.1 DNA polymerase III subunit delta [Alphaproteobacteria bacterium]MBU1813521.1 DNA polymerase III subunit delta [Alphaproteobacteria bacterium]